MWTTRKKNTFKSERQMCMEHRQHRRRSKSGRLSFYEKELKQTVYVYDLIVCDELHHFEITFPSVVEIHRRTQRVYEPFLLSWENEEISFWKQIIFRPQKEQDQ